MDQTSGRGGRAGRPAAAQPGRRGRVRAGGGAHPRAPNPGMRRRFRCFTGWHPRCRGVRARKRCWRRVRGEPRSSIFEREPGDAAVHHPVKQHFWMRSFATRHAGQAGQAGHATPHAKPRRARPRPRGAPLLPVPGPGRSPASRNPSTTAADNRRRVGAAEPRERLQPTQLEDFAEPRASAAPLPDHHVGEPPQNPSHPPTGLPHSGPCSPCSGYRW